MIRRGAAARSRLFKLGACIAFIFPALAVLAPVRAAERVEPLYRFAPVPRWVKPLAAQYDAPLPEGGVSGGSWDLLLDRQINVTPQGDEYYEHSATKVITARGVDEQSEINIEVDPTFESLILHSLKVVRQGRARGEEQTARVTALPQETELRNRIYNGTYNINILLSDVRVGDVIEYEYTLRSRERLFPGRFATRLRVAWDTPLRWQRLRVLSPASPELAYRLADVRSGPSAAARRAGVHDGLRELEWEWHDLPAIRSDRDRPPWYSPWASIEASTWKDWSEVARRTAALFAAQQAKAVMDVVREIRAGGGTPAQQALRALQFVQEQIRYVSVSIGPGAYRPATPAVVLQRRFGDCKDKSLLLVTILRELGIAAQPALVSTKRGHVLDASLPTPYVFDHAIVRMQLGEDVFWLDGTADKQFSISTDAPADYERALVLDGATTGLTVIPRPAAAASAKRSEVLVDLRAGINKPATLKISTFYHGALADSQREQMADESPAQLQANYLDYIVQYYPHATSVAPPAIHDDLERNVLEVREVYNIDPPFTRSQRGRLELLLQADEIYRYVDRTKSNVRTAPLAIEYPVEVQQTVRALLPVLSSRWQFQSETVRIDNPVFRYKSVVGYSDSGNVPQLTLDYRYESLSDFVTVAALPTYQADRKRAYDDTGYYLRVPAAVTAAAAPLANPRALAPAARLTAFLSLLLGLFVAVRYVLRWDPTPAPSQPRQPPGASTWLWLPALVVTVTPLMLGSRLYTWSTLVDVESWGRLHDTVPERLQALAPVILLALTACGVLLLVAEIVLIYLFFTRRSSVPYIFIALEWALGLYQAAALTFAAAAHLALLPGDTLAGLFIGSVLRPAALTACVLRSGRIKTIFVERLPRSRVALATEAPSGP